MSLCTISDPVYAKKHKQKSHEVADEESEELNCYFDLSLTKRKKHNIDDENIILNPDCNYNKGMKKCEKEKNKDSQNTRNLKIFFSNFDVTSTNQHKKRKHLQKVLSLSSSANENPLDSIIGKQENDDREIMFINNPNLPHLFKHRRKHKQTMYENITVNDKSYHSPENNSAKNIKRVKSAFFLLSKKLVV